MLKSEADRLTRVIVCTPKEEYYQVENLKAHNIFEVANREKALKQHHRLKESLREFGAEVIDVSEFDGHPNSVFTRDPASKGFLWMYLTNSIKIAVSIH